MAQAFPTLLATVGGAGSLAESEIPLEFTFIVELHAGRVRIASISRTGHINCGSRISSARR